jgi:hypothetical protein
MSPPHFVSDDVVPSGGNIRQTMLHMVRQIQALPSSGCLSAENGIALALDFVARSVLSYNISVARIE